ncbi:chemotaxis protein CheW [Chloroflexus aggregans]|uniref:CheW protein n=1 Tax=Chloroflexus aggregans (strain MD-66 / DSM 9485) TaxID=326427 RepID=B8GCG9_CHLAD|nr:chemotaxis protein CheW [Chloroflexus aggregans]ACL25013.1 CheW protein [Chloroflexus aggregans DSM 9485]
MIKSSPTTMVVVCRIGSRFVALPMQTVVHTARLNEIAPLGDAPVVVCGMVSLYGATVPVIDGRSLLGEPPGYDFDSHILLAASDFDQPPEIGLLVDEVMSIHRVGTDGLAPPDHIDGISCGVIRDLPHPALLLDVDELFALAHGNARD